MTRPRRSAPGIAFAANRAGLFQSGNANRATGAARRQTLDIFAAGRRKQKAERVRRTLGVVGGVALVALAASARGVLGAAFALGGVALVVRGIAGRSVTEVAKLAVQKLRAATLDERVDEASWESFPASDPPAHSPAKG
jgi:hypothetical protein